MGRGDAATCPLPTAETIVPKTCFLEGWSTLC